MTQTPTMEQERPITLREQELLNRGKHLAEKLAVRDGLVESMKAEVKKRKEEIEELDEEISDVAQQLRDGYENRRQGDLFVDQTLPKDQAAQRLTEIARMAERHPFVGDVALDACTREDCGKASADQVHQPPVATERHTFVPDGSGEGKCWACPAPKDDAVHAEPAPAETPVPATSQLEEAFVCADCEAKGLSLDACTHPKSDGMWLGADGRKVCAKCRQAGIEAGTWPHEFRVQPVHRRKAGEPKKCRECDKPEDDAVHNLDATVGSPAAADIVVPEQAQPAAEASAPDPAFDFDASEPAPSVISTHRAIDTPAHGADDGPVGGEGAGTGGAA